mmetsp:Transcript_19657/g.42321  ORF Transcript_19657/g.42321 Transcript_19657/m.42321 type:complete len:116 (+) Transcript_19657:58-405(+)
MQWRHSTRSFPGVVIPPSNENRLQTHQATNTIHHSKQQYNSQKIPLTKLDLLFNPAYANHNLATSPLTLSKSTVSPMVASSTQSNNADWYTFWAAPIPDEASLASAAAMIDRELY